MPRIARSGKLTTARNQMQPWNSCKKRKPESTSRNEVPGERSFRFAADDQTPEQAQSGSHPVLCPLVGSVSLWRRDA